jgi:THO complex subunit 1
MCSFGPIDLQTQLLTPVRSNVPDAESYAKKVQMTELDLDMADTEEEKRELTGKKSSYVWKGLRLASKKQLSSFDRIEHGKGLEALQPATSSIEATGDGAAPDDQGTDPQDEHQSVEEQRPDQEQSQVTVESAA